MEKYEDLVALARICVRNARGTMNKETAEELRRLAREYQERAGTLNGGKLPALEGE